MVPQGPIEFPRLAAVAGSEQPSGHRATPHDAGLVGPAWCKSPDQLERPIDGLARKGMGLGHVTLGHRRIDGHSDFRPGFSTVARAVQLDSEVTVIERSENVTIS